MQLRVGLALRGYWLCWRSLRYVMLGAECGMRGGLEGRGPPHSGRRISFNVLGRQTATRGLCVAHKVEPFAGPHPRQLSCGDGDGLDDGVLRSKAQGACSIGTQVSLEMEMVVRGSEVDTVCPLCLCAVQMCRLSSIVSFRT